MSASWMEDGTTCIAQIFQVGGNWKLIRSVLFLSANRARPENFAVCIDKWWGKTGERIPLIFECNKRR